MKFHNKKVVAHPKLQSLFQTKWLPKIEKYLQPLVLNEAVIQTSYIRESNAVNLFLNMMDNVVLVNDFTLIDPGELRTVWYPGTIT